MKHNCRQLALLIACAGLILSAGCAATGPGLIGGESVLKPDRIIDLDHKRTLTVRQLVDRLAECRVVFLGEFHDHPVIHARQREIIQGLWAKEPLMVIGLEVFSRDYQSLLDDWVGGRISEKQFESRVAGKILNSETYAVYSPLLKWARDNGVPLLALNAPREITAKVAKYGLGGLEKSDRSKIAKDIVVGPDEYRRRVDEALGSHHGAMKPGNFFEAQVVWDETMAESLVTYLNSEAGRNRQAVVIEGNQHVWERYGTPDRVKRRLNVSQATVLMPLTSWDEPLTAEDADFAWVAPVIEAPPRPRLGVVLKTEHARLMVTEIAPGSEAERIGLKPGDRLVNLDGQPLNDAMDMHRVAVKAGMDAVHRLTYERFGSLFDIEFRFRAE